MLNHSTLPPNKALWPTAQPLRGFMSELNVGPLKSDGISRKDLVLITIVFALAGIGGYV